MKNLTASRHTGLPRSICPSYQKPEPLISYCIATYNRGRLLAERSLRSILSQSYKSIEVIVVGDCCTDDTEARTPST